MGDKQQNGTNKSELRNAYKTRSGTPQNYQSWVYTIKRNRGKALGLTIAHEPKGSMVFRISHYCSVGEKVTGDQISSPFICNSAFNTHPIHLGSTYVFTLVTHSQLSHLDYFYSFSPYRCYLFSDFCPNSFTCVL
jgi:hypothetical protein